jgi:glycosyltransferase involved in cell wall biosynthesis
MHVSLIVPAPLDAVTGGYGYDRRIISGLRALGHEVGVVELPGRYPVTDSIARDAACVAWDNVPANSLPILDGLGLPAFAGMDDALSARPAVGLIHHPLALETGLAEAERTAFHDLELRLFNRMSRLIVTSEFTAESLAARFGVERARIVVVTPGTDEAPRSTGASGAGCEILSVGSLIPRKGHDLLMRALARLFDLDWHLTIAGSPGRDPLHAASLMALPGELGIGPRVRFAGEVTGARLETLWHAADIFALATYFEGYGMAVAEALKRGLPVAVTAGGAASALVPPEAGVVCPPGDPDQLSKALRRLIFGRDLRREMSEAAWQTGQALPAWDTQAALFAQSLGPPSAG